MANKVRGLKRFIAMGMALSMLVGMLQVPAFAASGDENTQKKAQITSEGGVTGPQDGVTISKTISPTGVENYFDITLTVETTSSIESQYKEQDVDVVIVMDLSSTMTSKVGTTSTTRYSAAIQAASAFINGFADMSNGSSSATARRIGIVGFNTHGHEIAAMTTVKNSTQANNLINEMKTDTGKIINAANYDTSTDRWTNMEAGLKRANDMLKNSGSEHKYVIFLSDGYPTTYIKSGYSGYNPVMPSETIDWSKVGQDGYFCHPRSVWVSGANATYKARASVWGTNYSDKAADRADNQAISMKKNGITIYSVGIDLSGQSIDKWISGKRNDGEVNAKLYTTVDRYQTGEYVIGGSSAADFEKWMKGSTTTGIGSGYYKDYSNASQLVKEFGELVKDIEETVKKRVDASWVATDPVTSGSSNVINFLGFYEKDGDLAPSLTGKGAKNAENTATCEGSNISWKLPQSGYTTSTSGNVTTYKYKMKYRVRLANENGVFNPATSYNTNGTTTFSYVMIKDVNGKETLTDGAMNFKIPQVKGYLGAFSFTKVDEHRETVMVPGAEFTLTHDGKDCPVCEGDVAITIPPVTSGETGVVSFQNIPSGHTYTLTETKAPKVKDPATGETLEYVKNTTTYEVEVVYGRTVVTTGGKTVYDSDKRNNDMRVTNELDPEETTITVTKDWMNDSTLSNAYDTVETTYQIYKTTDVSTDPETGKLVIADEAVVQDELTITGEGSATSGWLPTIDVETGAKIAYTVVEVIPDGANYQYISTDGSGTNFTVRNLLDETRTLTITKEWIAPEDYSSSGSIEVQLKQDDAVYNTYELNARNDWTKEVKDLPMFRPNGTGETYSYTVAELGEDGEPTTTYTAKDGKTFSVKVSGTTVTNTIDQETTVYSGTKTWKYAALKADELEDIVATIELYADGEATGRTVEVPASGGTWSFTGLPTYALPDNEQTAELGVDLELDGHKIVYTAREAGVTGDYEFAPTHDDKTAEITNTLTGKISIPVEKVWEDDDDALGRRPKEVTFELWIGDTFTEKTITLDATLYEGEPGVPGTPAVEDDPETPEDESQPAVEAIPGTPDEWVWEEGDLYDAFEDLDKYDPDGNVIVYTVVEAGVEDNKLELKGSDDYYNVSHTGDMDEGYVFTNTLNGDDRSIPVTKIWNDGGETPEGVYTTITLWADNSEDPVGTVTLPTEEGKNTYTFTELDTYDEDGRLIKYTVTETAVEGYNGGEAVEATGDMDKGFTFTNTIDQEESVSVSVEKVWKGEDPAHLPGVTVYLYGADKEEPVDSIKLPITSGGEEMDTGEVDGDGNPIYTTNPTTVSWSHTWSGLEKFHYDAKTGVASVINYTVKEEMTGDMAKHFTGEVKGTMAEGYTIENSFTPATTEVKGEKVWISGDHSAQVMVALYEKYGETEEELDRKETVDLGYSWTGLPLFKNDGTAISYYVRELDADGNRVEPGEAYDENHTTTYESGQIINRLNQKNDVPVSVTKTWRGPAADSVSFTVTRSVGDEVDTWRETITLTAEDEQEDGTWYRKLEGLERYNAEGYEWQYDVSEDGVDPDTGLVELDGVTYKSQELSGNIFVNTVEEEFDASLSVEKLWDSTATDRAEPTKVTIQLLANGVAVDEIVLPMEATSSESPEPTGSPEPTESVAPARTSDPWSYEWTDLRRYDPVTLLPIEYSVKEKDESGGIITLHKGEQHYEVTYSDVVDGHQTVTNTRIEAYYYRVWRYYESNINGKISNYTDHDVDRDEDGKGGWTKSYKGEIPKIDASLWVDCATDDDDQVYKFQGDKTYVTNGEGEAHEFTTEDGTVVVFTVEKYDDNANYYNVYLHYYYSWYPSYTPSNPTTSVTVNKVWSGDEGLEVRPATITVNLLQDGEAVDSTVLSERNNWRYTWRGLEIGHTWSVEEPSVPEGYTSSVSNSGNRYTITNTYTEPEPNPSPSIEPGATSVTVNKVWSGDEGLEVRPATITVNLLQDGEAAGSAVLSESTGWSYTWSGLASGYTWTVEEASVPEGYTSSVSGSGTSYTITNTYSESGPGDEPGPGAGTTSVTVNKVWSGDEGLEVRPATITVNLLQDGEVAGSVVLSESTGWSYTWNDLASGSTWTVAEDSVPEGYTSSVSGSGTSYTITNTYGEPEPTPSSEPGPGTEPGPEPEPEIEIFDEEVPLAELPDDGVPLADLPKGDPMEEILLLDEEVPLADVPKTGDSLMAWFLAAALSGIGLAGLSLTKRKEEE